MSYYDPKDAATYPKGSESHYPVAPAGINFGIITKIDFNYISKSSGKRTCEVIVTVEHNKEEIQVYAYLPYHPRMLWKIKHMCVSAGELGMFNSGNLDEGKILGKPVTVNLTVTKYLGKYKNEIEDFLPRSSPNSFTQPISTNQVSSVKADTSSDAVPF